MHGLFKLFSVKSVVSKVRVSLGLAPLNLNQGSAKGPTQLSTRNRYPSEQYTNIEATDNTVSHAHIVVKSAYTVDVNEYALEDLEGTKTHRY